MEDDFSTFDKVVGNICLVVIVAPLIIIGIGLFMKEEFEMFLEDITGKRICK